MDCNEIIKERQEDLVNIYIISKKYEIPDNIEDTDAFADNFSINDDKELTDVDIMNPEDLIDNDKNEEFQKLADQAMGIEEDEHETTPE